MEDTVGKISKLKEYFEGRQDVVMAFLFGSQAKGYSRVASDWDIGVYLLSESRILEQEIWADVERLLNSPVDLVVLNRAPASIAWNIIRGDNLIVRDRNCYLRFLLRVSHEANAWYKTAEDYHRVFERSASLSQEDSTRLKKIIQFLEVETADYAKFRALTWEEYTKDRAKKREVERWAEQLMNAVIDTAEIVLASERRVIPETYREIVRILGTVSAFSENTLCEQLSEWTDLRNVLAHEYLDYKWKQVSEFVRETEPLLRNFIVQSKTFVNAS